MSERLILTLAKQTDVPDLYTAAEVTIRIPPGAKDADITDALQRAVCQAYEVIKGDIDSGVLKTSA